MLHADEIDAIMSEQIMLSEKTAEESYNNIQSYLRNMDICPDCLTTVGMAWVDTNLIELFDPFVLHAGYLATFVRGFTIGLIAGRQHPTVEGETGDCPNADD